jgi:hypothetical protein
MKVFVKALVLGGLAIPAEVVETSLHRFFIDDVAKYQDKVKYPLTDDDRHGGCQFAFDRDQQMPLRCIDCNRASCVCPAYRPRNRYALQRFTETRVYILDIDPNPPRKSYLLPPEQEQELRQMEQRIKTLDAMFFYRTKSNGFRIGFEAPTPITTPEHYKDLCMSAEQVVKAITPDLRLEERIATWFHSDRIHPNADPQKPEMRSNAFWSYPRVQNPVWLSPHRSIE